MRSLAVGMRASLECHVMYNIVKLCFTPVIEQKGSMRNTK